VKARAAVVFEGYSGFVVRGGVWQDALITWIGRVVLAGFLTGLVACATAPTSEEEVKKLVADRATARWEALIKGDYAAAYGFFSNASREATSLDLYKAKLKHNIWKGVEVKSVACDGKVCNVNIEVSWDYKLFKGVKTDLTEAWIIEDGTARFVYKG
jgi:hypothetical protein